MKQITVKDEFGNPFVLHFTAKTVETMEKSGFNIYEIDTKPQTMTKMLWNGAFLAEHKNCTQEIKDKIYASLKNKEGLLTKLVELYNEPLDELIAEGNAEWEANF